MKDNKSKVDITSGAEKIERGKKKSRIEKLTTTTDPAVPNRAHTEMKKEQKEEK